MALVKTPLGMNARNFLYIRRFNKSRGKRIADDKLLTKKLLLERGLSTTALIATFINHQQVRRFRWEKLPEKFVVKPSRGYGGEGVLVVLDWDGEYGKDPNGTLIDKKELTSHVFNILEGIYSLGLTPDNAFVEAFIKPKKMFKNIPSIGVPDIRIVVFQGIPSMAMLRLPTEISGGKANLHQGALGIGIDIATGITTYSMLHGKRVTNFPETKHKLNGLKIPGVGRHPCACNKSAKRNRAWFRRCRHCHR